MKSILLVLSYVLPRSWMKRLLNKCVQKRLHKLKKELEEFDIGFQAMAGKTTETQGLQEIMTVFGREPPFKLLAPAMLDFITLISQQHLSSVPEQERKVLVPKFIVGLKACLESLIKTLEESKTWPNKKRIAMFGEEHKKVKP